MLKPRSTYQAVTHAGVHALRARLLAEPIDSGEAEFRLGTVYAGAWVTMIVCVPALIYALTVTVGTDRTVFFMIWTVTLIGGLTALVLPWRRIINSRWREAAFLTWTLMDGVIGYAAFALAYGESMGRLVLVLGGLGAAALMSWLQAQNHERRRLELAHASITDPLTGALNRRGLHAAATASLAALQRSGSPVALILIDLDDFKTFNDNHGHAAGDALLTWIAERARGELRPMDSVARIGGDEFAVLVANADATAAARIAQRTGAACGDRVALCTGIASAPRDGCDFDALYRAADSALYGAKRHRQAAARDARAERRQPWRGSAPSTNPT